MRGRKKEPDGRRVTFSIKFSEAEAAEIDAARGETGRGAWLRDAALTAARNAIPPEEADGIAEWLGAKQLQELADHAAAMEARAVQPKLSATVTPLRSAKACKHRNLRMTKGVCPDCREYVAKK